MAKRYIKGKHYTLCLLKQDKNCDLDTWCVNVTFIALFSFILKIKSYSAS